MKFLSVIYLTLTCKCLFGQWHADGIEVSITALQPLSYYYRSGSSFNDRYTDPGEYSFDLRSGSWFASKKIKRAEAVDMNGKLLYFSELDTLGRTLETGNQMENYFVKSKFLNNYGDGYCIITEYWEAGKLMKLDSNFSYEKVYNPNDTSFAYSVDERIVYMRGSLINEQNRYYNEKYEGRNFARPSWYVYFGEETDSVQYLEKLLKTDYSDTSFYKASHVRGVVSTHHYINEYELEFQDVQQHPFFQFPDHLRITEYLVDGADFSEPVFLQERMWCGNSIYSRHNYDSGYKYVATQNKLGLQDTFYLDFYDVDPNPPKVQISETPDAGSGQFVIGNLVPTGNIPVARVQTPVREAKLVFCYDYY